MCVWSPIIIYIYIYIYIYIVPEQCPIVTCIPIRAYCYRFSTLYHDHITRSI